jgi:hypothetical protein
MKYQTTRSTLTIIWLLVCGLAAADEIDAAGVTDESKIAFFERLAEVLPGNWDAQYASGSFDNPTSEWQSTRVEYSLTSGGTAIVEDYLRQEGSVPYMTTVYHQDNNDIRATHFCGAQNHPRMISRMFDAESKTMKFGFVDVSNLKSPEDYHSREIELTIVDKDNVRVTFHGLEDDQQSARVFALSRMDDDG